MPVIKVVSGYHLEGYAIAEYLSPVTGSCVIGTGFLSEFTASFADFFGTKSQRFSDKINEARDAALKRMTDEAALYHANAVIGLHYDFMPLTGNMIGVMASGTAVRATDPDGNPVRFAEAVRYAGPEADPEPESPPPAAPEYGAFLSAVRDSASSVQDILELWDAHHIPTGGAFGSLHMDVEGIANVERNIGRKERAFRSIRSQVMDFLTPYAHEWQ